MPSEALRMLVDDNSTHRERIIAYFRSKGKVDLSDKDREILDRAEEVHSILMKHRADMSTAKQIIKDKFSLIYRSQVDRLIEDAVYLIGSTTHMDKSYQRVIQLQDIEWGISVARDTKDLAALEKLLARREKLFQLDTPDDHTEFNYFDAIVINLQFMPEKFTSSLPADAYKRAEKIKLQAMEELGLIEDAEEIPDGE